MNYRVNEIFKSIQGEGFQAGMPAFFVRLSGCNLQCPWCDTDHSKYTELTDIQILQAVDNLDNTVRDIIITGGEPTLFKLKELIDTLHKYHYRVSIESNAIRLDNMYLNHNQVILADYIAASPKFMNGKFLYGDCLSYCDEIRIVNDKLTIDAVLEIGRHLTSQCNRYISVLELDGKFNLQETLEFLYQLNKVSPWKWYLNQQHHKTLGLK